MYFPKISNSTLTTSFSFKYFKFVNFSVWGITTVWNPSLKILEIVNETPLIAIDPFWIKYFLYFFDNLKLINQDLPIASNFLIILVVSTWPWTKCPEKLKICSI